MDLAQRVDLAPFRELGSGHGGARRVHFRVQPPPGEEAPAEGEAAARYLRLVQWPAHIHPAFEAVRTSPKLVDLLEPLLGRSLAQYLNQVRACPPLSR